VESDYQPGTIQVWVSGSHTLLNQGLVAMLSGVPGILPVLETSASPTSQPKLVLLLLPASDHLDTVIQHYIHQQSSARVLVLSLAWTPEVAVHALQAGAAGCLNADLTPGELAAALRQASRGEIVLSADLQHAIVLEMARSPASTNVIPFERLSERERDVLVLICQGLSNKQIAQHLYLSVRTVENHLRRLYQKLGVSSRTEAAVLAMQQGWFRSD